MFAAALKRSKLSTVFQSAVTYSIVPFLWFSTFGSELFIEKINEFSFIRLNVSANESGLHMSLHFPTGFSRPIKSAFCAWCNVKPKCTCISDNASACAENQLWMQCALFNSSVKMWSEQRSINNYYYKMSWSNKMKVKSLQSGAMWRMLLFMASSERSRL